MRQSIQRTSFTPKALSTSLLTATSDNIRCASTQRTFTSRMRISFGMKGVLRISEAFRIPTILTATALAIWTVLISSTALVSGDLVNPPTLQQAIPDPAWLEKASVKGDIASVNSELLVKEYLEENCGGQMPRPQFVKYLGAFVLKTIEAQQTLLYDGVGSAFMEMMNAIFSILNDAPHAAYECPLFMTSVFRQAADWALSIGHRKRARILLQIGNMFKLASMNSWWAVALEYKEKGTKAPKALRSFHPRMQMEFSLGLTILTQELLAHPLLWRKSVYSGRWMVDAIVSLNNQRMAELGFNNLTTNLRLNLSHPIGDPTTNPTTNLSPTTIGLLKTKPVIDVLSICVYNPDPTSNTILESPLPQMSPINHRAYVEYTGLNGYFLHRKLLLPKAEAHYSKFLVVLQHMIENPDTDWVFFIDCDAFFTDFDTTIFDLIKTYIDVDNNESTNETPNFYPQRLHELQLNDSDLLEKLSIEPNMGIPDSQEGMDVLNHLMVAQEESKALHSQDDGSTAPNGGQNANSGSKNQDLVDKSLPKQGALDVMSQVASINMTAWRLSQNYSAVTYTTTTTLAPDYNQEEVDRGIERLVLGMATKETEGSQFINLRYPEKAPEELIGTKVGPTDVLNQQNPDHKKVKIRNTINYLVAEDTGGINTGVFLMRNCQWSVHYLQQVMKSAFTTAWDQSMFFVELVNRTMYDFSDDFHLPEESRFIHQAHLNGFVKPASTDWQAYEWQQGDFGRHFAGCPWQEKPCLKMMQETLEFVESVWGERIRQRKSNLLSMKEDIRQNLLLQQIATTNGKKDFL